MQPDEMLHYSLYCHGDYEALVYHVARRMEGSCEIVTPGDTHKRVRVTVASKYRPQMEALHDDMIRDADGYMCRIRILGRG